MRCFKSLLAAVLLLTSCGAYRSAFSADEGAVLRFATYGGGLLEGQKSYLGEPFEYLTGAKIQWTPANEEIFAEKLLIAGGRSAPFDLVLLDDPWYSLVRARGLLEPLDEREVPNLARVRKEFRLPQDMGVCWGGILLGIVYSKAKYSELGLPAPAKWQDLADPKLSGHVGTQTLAGTAPKFLLAAYAMQLGDPPTKWDRAIDEVAKIKFHSFSKGVADLMAKVEAGDVWAAPMVAGRAYSMIRKGLPLAFVLPDNGNGSKGGISCGTISIPKNGRNRPLAEKLISLYLSPGVQLMEATADTPYGPVISGLDPILQKAPLIGDLIPWGATVTNGFRLPWSDADLDRFSAYVDAWNRKVQR
ncbi:MAG TPA: extracellular solute-binding protein [Xanthobacteraceae bacterium]